ncbi:MAG: pyrroline-5-carboxylate reductase [Actinomycetia bacterium]|nr:pyrroline-5-carboxylate reductase [Actinomycetes bacterium]
MGQALLGGLIRAKWAAPTELTVVEVIDQQRQSLEAAFPGVQVLAEPRAGVDTIVAVKPDLAVNVCRGLDQPARIVSIAAGITIAAMEAALPADTPVVRVMPNTPSLVGFGAAGVAGGTAASADDVGWAVSILAAVGEAVVVPEHLLDAVTGLSGSGPAYVFLVAEALIDAGVSAGLPADVSATLAGQTLLGAATLLMSGQSTAAELRAGVTTPAGTTAAGLRVLEQKAIRAAFIDAVQAATDRSRQLGQGG